MGKKIHYPTTKINHICKPVSGGMHLPRGGAVEEIPIRKVRGGGRGKVIFSNIEKKYRLSLSREAANRSGGTVEGGLGA